MIGILHAFVLLKPTLEKSMRNCNKIESSMRFMHKNGFNTHSRRSIKDPKNKKLDNCSKNNAVPIISRDDANHFLQMEYRGTQVEMVMSSLFNTLQDGLGVMG